MKYLRILGITAAVLLIFIACGKKEIGEESLEPESGRKVSKETNEIIVVFSDQEEYSPGVFQLEKTLAFVSGMRYNAESTAKLVYVVFANYEVNMGLYYIEPPVEPGQIAILLSFKTKNLEIPLEQQIDAKKLNSASHYAHNLSMSRRERLAGWIYQKVGVYI